jgi:signal transduction histidine kinase/DNA-binding response OmpR family regulator
LNVWVATNRGISKLQNKSVKFYSSYVVSQQAGCNEFRSLNATDKEYILGLGGDNTLWIAEFSLRDSLNFVQFNFEEPNVPWSNFISSWIGKHHFWIATWGRGVIGLPINQTTKMIEHGPAKYLSHDPKNTNTLSTNETWSIYEDEEETLWVGTFSGLNMVNPNLRYGEKGSVTRYNHDPQDSSSISHDIVRQILPQDERSLWVATEVGVDLFEKQKGKFEHPFKNRETVSVIHKSKDGTMFVGTQGGLYETRKKQGQITFTKSPIFSESITYLAEDQLGRLWYASYNGIVCFDRKRQIAIRINERDGLHDSEGNLFQIENGVLVYSNGESIAAFDPKSLVTSEKQIVPVLTNVSVNNSEPVLGNRLTGIDAFRLAGHVSTIDELELDYQHNNFSLEFAAMEMTAPEKNLYRHKLEGYDPDWIETDWKQRTGTYTNLPAGDYTFRVRASNKHGVWSDQERTLKVKILPPPWRTWWAYSAYSFFVAGLLVLARRTIVQRERLKASFRLEHMELEKAKEIDKIKTSFFTNISHEFRTPLTLIKGPVQDVLEKYRDDAVVQTKLKLVQRNSDLLLKLINQLLDLSRLEAGTLRIEKTDIDTFGFVRAVSSSFESLARQKDLNLEIKVPTWSEPAAVDRDKLETIIINLVNNAIKFTPSGGTVTVTCTLKECILTLEVADTGIGIPKDQQFRVFERFYQVSNTHKEVGTGIGLALAKELVTLMGGAIQLKSTPGEGSSFSVQLPVEPVANAHEVPLSYVDHKSQENGISSIQHRTGNDEVHSTKPAVLVVEDNNDLRHFIIDCLGDEFDFLQADNGKKGLETATDNIPDLIISDVMMPEMDGITMTGKLKADVRTSHIPLILLTAKSTEDSKLHGLSSGADDYLTKPFNKSELLLKVRNGITRQQKLREKLRADLISTAPKVNVLSADEKFLDKVKGCILARLGDEQLSVESLAEEIGLSRVQLYRKVIALTGLSVNELIRKLRLQRASQLLKQKWGPVSQVAYEVGFSNLSYFSKVFKEEFGALPSEFSVEKMD